MFRCSASLIQVGLCERWTTYWRGLDCGKTASTVFPASRESESQCTRVCLVTPVLTRNSGLRYLSLVSHCPNQCFFCNPPTIPEIDSRSRCTAGAVSDSSGCRAILIPGIRSYSAHGPNLVPLEPVDTRYPSLGKDIKPGPQRPSEPCSQSLVLPKGPAHHIEIRPTEPTSSSQARNPSLSPPTMQLLNSFAALALALAVTALPALQDAGVTPRTVGPRQESCGEGMLFCCALEYGCAPIVTLDPGTCPASVFCCTTSLTPDVRILDSPGKSCYGLKEEYT
jgi:hypothetical protein